MKKVGIFVVVIGLVFIAVSQSSFKSESNDSKFYSFLVQRYENNFAQALTPIWGKNYYGFSQTDYIIDHPPGHILMGLVFARLGVPAWHGLRIYNMVLFLLSLFIIVQLMKRTNMLEEAASLAWSLQLLFINLSSSLRANHEPAMLFYLLLGVWGTFNLRNRQFWGFLAITISLLMGLFTKGLFVIPILGAIFISLILTSKRQSWKVVLKRVVLICGGIFIVVAITQAYLAYFQEKTGIDFLSAYIDKQLKSSINVDKDSKLVKTFGGFLTDEKVGKVKQKAINFKYYMGRAILYSLPWSLLFLVLLIRKTYQKKAKELYLLAKDPLISSLFLIGFIYLCMFSLADRTASRYIFPVFYLWGASFFALAYSSSESLKKLVKKVGSLGHANVALGLWASFILVHLALKT